MGTGEGVPMCEMLARISATSVEVASLLPWARLMESRGVAGFGWGVAWYEDGRVRRYRSELGVCRDDVAEVALAGVRSAAVVVHLRRPSLLMGVRLENSQPYLDDATGVAFCHNGYFRRHQEFRAQYAAQLEGTSDSEVGFRRFLDASRTEDAMSAMRDVAATLEGNANLLVLLPDGGRVLGHAGHEDNPMYRFRMDGARWIATGLHSPDGYVCKRLFTRAEQVEEIGRGQAVEL